MCVYTMCRERGGDRQRDIEDSKSTFNLLFAFGILTNKLYPSSNMNIHIYIYTYFIFVYLWCLYTKCPITRFWGVPHNRCFSHFCFVALQLYPITACN